MRAAEELRYLILAIQREGNRILAADLRPLGLTPSQAEVLRVLADFQPLTLTGLGELLVCEHGTNPSRLVDRLVAAGLVRRETQVDDRRRVTLSLTTDGERLTRRIIDIEDQLYRTLDALTADQPVEQALTVLRALAGAFPVANALSRRSQRPARTTANPAHIETQSAR
ncbi:MAG: MarR family winged helix-turn-helix transcriptional regulator [Pseudonocardiaceae bacterium]